MNALEHWLDLIAAAVGSFITAAVGVAMRHAHKIQQGEKFSWGRIALDGPTVLFMGILGGAAGDWLHVVYQMPELFGSVIAASGGYLGPNVVDKVLDWIDKRIPKQ